MRTTGDNRYAEPQQSLTVSIIMDLIDFIPFRNEFAKAQQGLTSNATHTSENPLFNELKVRRYDKPGDEITEFIVNKIEKLVGWNLKSEKTAVGGMTTIRADVSSFILLGMKIDVTFGLLEEKDIKGKPVTTVNAKAETNIESRGDLGESRRVIRMMLCAMDFEFRAEIISEEDYLYRSVETTGSAAAFQQIFDEARLQHQEKPQGTPKATTIEFKKKPAIQTITLKTATTPGDATTPPAAVSYVPEQNGSSPSTGSDESKPSKPKFTIITTKKTL